MALAVMGSIAMGAPSGASADTCSELDSAIDYHARRGNWGFAYELAKIAENEGCEVIRDRSPKADDHRMIAE
jgi:hypothetical protein